MIDALAHFGFVTLHPYWDEEKPAATTCARAEAPKSVHRRNRNVTGS
ncbi:MAG: hypothetical protein ACF8AM_03045 [Rhodopirellula sp. JB055]